MCTDFKSDKKHCALDGSLLHMEIIQNKKQDILNRIFSIIALTEGLMLGLKKEKRKNHMELIARKLEQEKEHTHA